MIPTFLRRPHGAGELVADGIRVATVVSVVVATIGWGFVAFGVMMLALLGVLVPRALGLRPAFDVVVSAAALVAAWSSALGWYTSVPHWDKVVHVVLGGVIAGVMYVIAERVAVVPQAAGPHRLAVVVLTLVFGLGIGAVWEMAEWAGHTFIDATIFVGYQDTIGDLAADGSGALLCGLALRFLAARSRFVPNDTGRSLR